MNAQIREQQTDFSLSLKKGKLDRSDTDFSVRLEGFSLLSRDSSHFYKQPRFFCR